MTNRIHRHQIAAEDSDSEKTSFVLAFLVGAHLVDADLADGIDVLGVDLHDHAKIANGPILFADLWGEIPYEQSFEDMQAALAELIEAGEIVQIDDTFAFKAA